MPVLNRPTWKPISCRFALRLELVSAIRPPGLLFSPTCKSPRKNVPEVITTVRAAIATPMSVSTPITAPASSITRDTVPCLTSRFCCLLQNGFHPKLVRLLVALNSGRTYRWTLSLVQHSKLNPGCISVKSHRSSHRVDFANNMSFCQSADCRVARHLPDSIQVLGQHQRAAADSGGCQCRFDSGMSAPYYDYVVIVYDNLNIISLLRR